MSGLRATSGDDDTFIKVEKGCLFLLTARLFMGLFCMNLPGSPNPSIDVASLLLRHLVFITGRSIDRLLGLPEKV
mgnify:CR=1 FL=1|tara:strand:+ start:225 stop:449 length:225 start_codon:yes stop_codon:yes gene_type:complete